jgi:hypothetical protein
MANGTLKVWALETANRVKMIQASWADDDKVSRQETVRQELRRSLDSFSGSDRAERLEALKLHFPVWDQNGGEVITVEREAPPRALTPQELLDQLVAAAPRLTDKDRQAFSKRLLDAGFAITKAIPSAPATSPAPTPAAAPTQEMEFLPEQTARKLGEKGQVRTYPTQVFNVLHELLDCTMTLATAARGAVEEMYRRGEMTPPRDREDDSQLRAAVSRYLKGESGASSEQMRQAVQKVRSRTAAMLLLPAKLPGKMSERLVKLVHPDAITRMVEREGRLAALVKDPKVRCWEKYERLWNDRGLGQTQNSMYWDVDFAKDVVAIVEGQNAPN